MALRRSKPKTLTDRVKAGGAIATDAAQAVGTFGAEAARTVRDRAVHARRDPKSAIDDGRKRALGIAGAAAGAAGAFAFWRSKRDDRPPTHVDPAPSDPAPAATPAPEPATEAEPHVAPPAKSGATG